MNGRSDQTKGEPSEGEHMADIKHQAEAFRVGLLAGYVEPAEVITWADQVIAAGDVPRPGIIEVSLAGSKPVAELAHALGEIEGATNSSRLAWLIFRQMAAAVRHNPAVAPQVARTLHQMYLGNLVPSAEARVQMSRLDDAFELAASGAWGTPNEAQAELVAFLSEWSEEPA